MHKSHLLTAHPLRIVCHGRQVLKIASRFGWLPGARYTNLRDIRGSDLVGLIDIDWRDYDFKKHLATVKAIRPMLTVARDVEDEKHLPRILDQAWELSTWCPNVIIVPKDPKLAHELKQRIPRRFILGFSVPTKYGGTRIPLEYFQGRAVHLLGGRPDTQRRIADFVKVVSVDSNRFTIDASYGDFFDGQKFRPHPKGGYTRCITDSIRNIDRLWETYRPGQRSNKWSQDRNF